MRSLTLPGSLRRRSRMLRTSLSLAGCALALMVLSAAAQAPNARSYVVIINAANPTSSLTDAEIAKLFLKRKLRWDNGRPVVPVDQRSGSAIRASFSIDILRKKPSAVANYWQQQIFSAREVPPVEKSSDQAVIEFVQSNPDAIGYVAASTVLGSGVKTVDVIQP